MTGSDLTERDELVLLVSRLSEAEAAKLLVEWQDQKASADNQADPDDASESC